MATRKSLAAAIVCAGTVAGLAGCSQDGDVRAGSAAGGRKEPVAVTSAATAGPFKGMSADRIADKAIAAMKSADSLRMAGSIESDGDPVTVDLAMDSRDNCTGGLGVRGGRAELRRLSDVIYLKGDGAFWRATMDERSSASPDGGGDGVVELMTDRWVKMPTSAIADMRGVCDLDAMLSELDDEDDPAGMTLGRDTEVDGVPVATLVKKEGRETTTAYVAKEGSPYLLKVVRAGGDDAGSVGFSDFDEPVRVQAPPSDEVVDLEKLGGTVGPDPSGSASPDPDSDPDTGTGPSDEATPSSSADAPEEGEETGFGAGAERGGSGRP